MYNVLPNNTQIELVEGCNRFCNFCGLYGIWKHKKHRVIKYMDLGLAEELAKAFGKWWTKGKRIEFAMHGEPTLHPDVHSIIAKFRSHNPLAQLQLTSNGLKLIKEGPKYINALFTAGLNFLLVDTYTRVKEIRTVSEASEPSVMNYYDPFTPNVYYYHGNKTKVIILVADLAEMSGAKKQRVILNHAGNSDPIKLRALGIKTQPLPLQKKCSRLFREMVVHYDGTVPLCCIDWKHEFIIGRFPELSLPNLWNHPTFNLMRNFLFNKDRRFRPCYKCDYNGGFRLGLLKWNQTPIIETDQEQVIKHLQENDYAHPNTKDPLVYNNKGIKAYL